MKLCEINWFIVFITVFGILTKLAGVFLLPVYHDVGWYRPMTEFNDGAYMNLLQVEHPYFGYYFFLAALKFVGVYDFVIRLVTFVFSLVEVVLLYLLAKKWCGIKTANAVLILWSLTFFAYVNALSADVDGSLMSVFSIFLFFFFYTYTKTSKTKYLLITGLFYGALMLIKLRGVIFILPMMLFALYQTRSLKNTLWLCVKVGVLGLMVFSLFPIAAYIANPVEFFLLIEKMVRHNVTNQPSVMFKLTHPLIFLQVLVVLSPLYLFLLSGWLRTKKLRDVDVLLIMWLSSLFALFLLIIPPMPDVYPRYVSFLLPPLILLSARKFASFGYKTSQLLFLLSAAVLLYFVTNRINEAANDYWFYASAAMGVYKLTQSLLVFYFIAAIIIGLIYAFTKNRVMLASFLIVTIAFNLHFIFEPVVDQTHPKLIKDLISSFCINKIKKPLFVWAEDIAFYLGSSGMNIKLVKDSILKQYAERIGYNKNGHFYINWRDTASIAELKSKGGTVFTFYYPSKYALKDIDRQNEDAYLRKNCKMLKSAIYRTGRGEVWEC